jgi:iron complex outermembrane receptor protein
MPRSELTAPVESSSARGNAGETGEDCIAILVRWCWRLAAVMVVVTALSTDGHAQDGRITGVVRGSGGQPLPGARISATNSVTRATSNTTTAADGRYILSGLPAGPYTVSATVLGYRRAFRSDVQVPSATSVDFALEWAPLSLQAVTVTATLREQELSDVPFSIAAPTASVLRERGAEDLEAVAANVASFSVQNLGPGQSQVALRGASAGQIARDQPGVKESVGIYLDDSPISLSLFTPDMDLFDVARVEVLRGPQGTLFGTGSLSGTVRYITNQPEPGVNSVFGETGGHWVAGGAAGATVKLGMNVPLSERVAGRLAVFHNRLAGWQDAVRKDLSLDENINGGERTGARAALRIAPTERLTITPRLVFQNAQINGWNRTDTFNILANPYTTSRPAVTLGDRKLFIATDEPYRDDFVLGDLALRYDFGAVNVTSITSYLWRDIVVTRDGGALYASIVGGTIGMPEAIYTLDAPFDDKTGVSVWTQEVRLAGGGDRVKWLLGGFYARADRDYGQSVRAPGFEAATGAPTQGTYAARDELFFSDLAYELRQAAVFAEGTVTVGDRLDLTAGMRYYDFSEHREQVFDGFFVGLISQPGSTNASGVAPRFIASLRATDAVTLNAQASRGFRLGGINDPLNTPICTPQDLATFSGRDSWNDETAWNYEVGTRAALMHGRVSLNLSAFYMDISDLQLTVTAGSCSSRLIYNVPARSRGAEIEFAAAPSRHFDFSVSGSFNDSEVRSTVTSTDTAGNVTVVGGIQDGNRLPSVPRVKIAAAVTYRHELGSGAQGSLTGTVQHIGSRYTLMEDLAAGFGTVNLDSFAPNTIGGPLTQQSFQFDPELPAYTLMNLRVAVARGNWETALFINNLTDTRAFLALDRERGTLARVGYLTNQPRTVGVSLRFEY